MKRMCVNWLMRKIWLRLSMSKHKRIAHPSTCTSAKSNHFILSSTRHSTTIKHSNNKHSSPPNNHNNSPTTKPTTSSQTGNSMTMKTCSMRWKSSVRGIKDHNEFMRNKRKVIRTRYQIRKIIEIKPAREIKFNTKSINSITYSKTKAITDLCNYNWTGTANRKIA